MTPHFSQVFIPHPTPTPIRLYNTQIVARTGKLTYQWRGLDHLDSLLERFADDEAQGLPVEERNRRAPTDASRGTEDPKPTPTTAGKTPHTLWALSRKFVRVLLTRRGPIPLTDVAQLLIGNSVVEARRSQTQITIERRLYDIGSILTAVGLIQKAYLGRRYVVVFHGEGVCCF